MTSQNFTKPVNRKYEVYSIESKISTVVRNLSNITVKFLELTLSSKLCNELGTLS